MDIWAELEMEHSKACTLRIVDWVGESEARLGEVVDIVVAQDQEIARRAAWVVSHCAEAEPGVVGKFLGELLNHLVKPGLHDAVKRNVMKAATLVPLEDEVFDVLAELGFRFMTSPREAVATQVYAMSCLFRVCEREPEMGGELRALIEEQLQLTTRAAFRSRARTVLRGLDKLP